jgi:hypothetical protein
VNELTELDAGVLRLAPAGGYPGAAILREQIRAITSVRRTFTGVGFYADLEVDHAAVAGATHTPNAVMDGISAQMRGLEYGAGFAVFVDQGHLSQIEGFTYDEPWPDKVTGLVLRTDDPGGLPSFTPRSGLP